MKNFLLITLIMLSQHSWSFDELCPTVKIKKIKSLKLTENEKHLLCGNKSQEGYKSVPAYQAQFEMKGFLQSRGFLRPEMEIKDGVLLIDKGEKSKVKNIYVSGSDAKVKKATKTELRHLFKRRDLSTSTLDSIEAEALAQVRKRGHPCASVSSIADIDLDVVNVELKKMRFHEFGEIKKENIEGLRKNALDRFYPFQANDPFNADLLQLTEKRMTRSDIVQATYFLENCQEENFDLKQRFIPGPPRSIRYGIGASTELGPMARIRWSNNRYKSMASQLSATAQTSLRTQSLTLNADSFFWYGEPRRSVFSEAEILREDQVDYEQLVYRLRPSVKWTRDGNGFHKLYRLGPAYEGGTYFSQESSSTRSFSSGMLTGALQWMSHTYELFDILPQEGQLHALNFEYRHPAVGFASSLMKLEHSSVMAHRMSNWGRGTLVGAGRITLGTSVVNTDTVSIGTLPPTVKFFGGGSEDIRGFYLQSLPKNDGVGALSKASVKLELRRTYLYWESLEGFAFVDGGKFGQESWNLKREIYYSPGIGLRWLSPIGLVQSYAARALSLNPKDDSGNFYYVGIGGSF